MDIFDTPRIEAIRHLLQSPKRIALTIHYNPDGDSLGSSLGLRAYLQAQGHTVQVLAPNALPRHYGWMPGADTVIDFEQDTARATEWLQGAELVFCLDYNELSRTGRMEAVLRPLACPFVLIDHHPDPEPFTPYLFSDTSVSSASELTYGFLMALYAPERFERPVAECLFTGILTDTGMFQHNSNHPATFRAVAHLLESGVDKDAIKYRIFDTNTPDRLRLMGFSLSERMVIRPEYRTGYIYLSLEDMQRFGYRKGDHEGFVNFPLSVEGIRFSILLIEQADMIKISMRSKGDFDVNTLIRTHFEGGGHKNAAGARAYVSLAQAIARIEELLPEYQSELLCD